MLRKHARATRRQPSWHGRFRPQGRDSGPLRHRNQQAAWKSSCGPGFSLPQRGRRTSVRHWTGGTKVPRRLKPAPPGLAPIPEALARACAAFAARSTGSIRFRVGLGQCLRHVTTARNVKSFLRGQLLRPVEVAETATSARIGPENKRVLICWNMPRSVRHDGHRSNSHPS